MSETKLRRGRSDEEASGDEIGARIKSLRGKLSAQKLADRTKEIGYCVSRATITELEIGRRKYVSIRELLALAAALETSVAEILWPGDGDVEVLPGVTVTRTEAVELLAGTGSRITRAREEFDRTAAEMRSSLVLMVELTKTLGRENG